MRLLPIFLLALVVAISGGCIETVTNIHERSEGNKARYLDHDPAAAHDHYLKAANNGDAEAQHQLAIMYLDGLGVRQDIAQFQELEEKSAAQQYPAAMRTLGFMLVTGVNGIRLEPRRGMSLLKAAAEEDDASAHYLLGKIYSHGTQEVQPNYRMAAYHYTLAEEEGMNVKPEMKNAAALERMGLPPLSAASQEAAPQTGTKYDVTSLAVRKYVQHTLKTLGYYPMAVDGIIGKESGKAIKAFQRDAGLDETGNIDDQLIDALVAAAKAKKN